MNLYFELQAWLSLIESIVRRNFFCVQLF